jgi:hypothetical protein
MVPLQFLATGFVRRSEADVRQFHLKTRWELGGERLSDWVEKLRKDAVRELPRGSGAANTPQRSESDSSSDSS